jgi:hypothetical protein
MDTLIQTIKTLAKKFFLQIIWFVIIITVINRLVIMTSRSHLRTYGYSIGSIMIIICLIIFPIVYLWNIKDAVIKTLGSYLITNKQDDIIQRVVYNYTTYVVQNPWVSDKLALIKNMSNTFPSIVQRIVNRMIDEIPVMNEIIDVIKDFNPINMSHEEITTNLSLKIQEQFAHSPLGNTTIREIYSTILICNICIWLLILGQICYTLFYTSS